MHLSSLSLINFKNYAEANLKFSTGVNCFTGNNGSGKTNIIDAIYYLSFTKSYFTASDTQNIKHGENLFVIQGRFIINGIEEDIFCGIKTGFKKQVKRGSSEYDRFSDHIGLLPVVMIAPVDHILISEGSEERRKFIDSMISQVDKTYLDQLISYNRLLMQRNAFLRQLHGKSPDVSLLDVWNEQLIAHGMSIEKARNSFMEEFVPLFNEFYQFLSENAETVSIHYHSQINENNYRQLLEQALSKDVALQYTTVGIHKDDLIFKIGHYPLKRIASQGQQKTFLIALKLAQFQYLQQHKHTKPILLLDDIFDKLDDFRVQRLMQLVSHHTFGQIFITDTHPERLKKIFEDIQTPITLFDVKDGNAVNVSPVVA